MPRTIEPTQRNAFTLIAKYLRDQGVPIRTRRDLVEYTDVGDIRNALMYWTGAYNQDVMNERKKLAKEKRDARNVENRELNTFRQNLQNQTFTIPVSTNKTLLKMIQLATGRFMVQLNGRLYALNAQTLERLRRLLEPNGNLSEDNTQSDKEFIDEVVGSATITFVRVPQYHGQQVINAGGFFPFTHSIPIDLSDLQIYPQFTPCKENCFVHALRASGLVKDLQEILMMCYGRDIPQCKLKEVAEKFKLYITIKRHTEENAIVKLVKYGNKDHPHLALGLIKEHYFLIKEMPITSYAVKHYKELCHLPDWETFYMEGKRSLSRYIDSYQLIKLLLEQGDMTPIVQTSEVLQSIYYEKTKEISHLEEVVNAKANVYIPKPESNFVNVFFDFETDTTQTNHVPYLCCMTLPNDETKTFFGEDCGKKMLYALSAYPKVRLIAHNAGYDIRFIIKYLCAFNMIDRGKHLLRGYGRFYHAKGQFTELEIQDSYALISSPLRDFGKMFKLEVEKEMMPYALYTTHNIAKRHIPVQTCLDAIPDCEDQKLFLHNCTRWECGTNYIDILKYSEEYCKIDCLVLSRGYNTFKKWIQEVCELNIDHYVSIPSLANDYMLKEGVYDDTFMLNGTAREFIQRAMVGGRTMISENKKRWIKEDVDDFDAVSLYPSAMKRLGELGGYLKGIPKVLKVLEYDFLQKQDGYFVEILITNVKKKFKFPLMSKKGDTRDFTNEMVGEILCVDKTSLEDLIEFQQIEFEIKRGYYYDHGRNPKILDVITHLFNTRKEEKKRKNPIEQVFKLLMNASYGKTLLKPFDSETKYTHDLNTHVSRHYTFIKEIVPLPNGTYKVEHYKSIGEHYNNVFIGVEVLSMSKRIMNEVMCLAEDLDIDISYQDTDSMHIPTPKVSPLAEAFEQKYNRELIGSDMGQFHTDFDSKICTGTLKSIESIYLGKKCYIDKLKGDGPEIDYHMRMKGVSNDSIQYYAQKHKLSVFDIYTQLYNGKKITFDLACDGTKCCFNFNSDLTISSLYKFERDIKF